MLLSAEEVAYVGVWIAGVQAVVGTAQAVISYRAIKTAFKVAEVTARLTVEAQKNLADGEMQKQAKSMRLLLKLEVDRNKADLTWLKDNLQQQPDNEVRRLWLSLHMPQWNHRIWYGQQSPTLIGEALNREEIEAMNLFHSELERLDKIGRELVGGAQASGKYAEPQILWENFDYVLLSLLQNPPLHSDTGSEHTALPNARLNEPSSQKSPSLLAANSNIPGRTLTQPGDENTQTLKQGRM